MNHPKPESRQRDWFLLLPLLLIGILLMQAAGRLATRLLPSWEVSPVNMDSLINPDDWLTAHPAGQPVAPLNAEILTPFAWNEILTPGPSGNATVIPFIIFPPITSVTPTASLQPTQAATFTAQPSATASLYPTKTQVIIIYPTLTPIPSKTPNPQATATPAVFPTSTPTIAATAFTTATKTVTPTPTDTETPTPTETITSTSTETPTPTETTTSTSTETPTPTETATSTETPANTETPTDTPIPSATPGTGGVILGPPDGTITILADGSSALIILSTPIDAYDPGSPDMVYYERAVGANILMDQVIIQVANNLAGPWYTVFNWGDGLSDDNTNVSMSVYGYTEADNESIPRSTLYGSGATQTGITIDVDGVAPAGTYQYVLISAPVSGAGDGADIDSLEILP